MRSSREPQTGRDELLRIIRHVRNRWRLRLIVRGAAIVLAAGLAALLITVYGLERFRFDPAAVIAARVIAYATLLALAVKFLVLPLRRRVTDEEVALYIEEHEPTLQASVITAVELGDVPRRAAERSPALTRRVVELALARTRAVDDGRRIERRALNHNAIALGGAAMAALLILAAGPNFVRHGLRSIFVPWGTASAANPYAIDVEPGHVTIARGADQQVTAMLRGFDGDRVELAFRRGSSEQWDRVEMFMESDSGGHRFRLFDIETPVEYYVESSGIRSAIFRIDVADLPFVRRVDLEYRFPAYTGLSPQTVEDGGDIAALRGTRVTITATPTMAVSGGRLQVDGQEPVAMTLTGDSSLTATIVVDQPGYYRIQLAGSDEVYRGASVDYIIDVLRDQPPTVRFLKPGRDSRVTSVDEVFAEVRAEDDYGIGRAELVYSVNGGAEKSIALLGAGARPVRELSAGHTFFLEEMSLEPGDVVSYYARVFDNDVVSGNRSASTDIYFLDVRPFGQTYRQQQGGGGGGGGSMDDPGQLSRQQRDIVAATFKVERDRRELGEKQVVENLTTLVLAQGRLRERTEELAQRMRERGVVSMDTTFAKIAELLPQAAAEMKAAEEELGRRRPTEALPPEQRALRALLQAEAAYREVMVQLGGGGGGGGGGNAPRAEDLADLFELEVDRMRNQYESVQRGEQQQQSQEIDEVMERLRQLAARQQQENERARQMRQQAGGGGGGGGGQRELAEQTEQAARQLERLARERQSQELAQAARRLQESADAMRRSAAAGGDRSSAEAAAALERLEEARRLMDRERNSRVATGAADALRRAEEIAERQRRIAADVDRFGESGDRAEEMRRLSERKQGLAEDVHNLERQLDRIARESQRDQPAASRRIREAAEAIRGNQIADKIRFSQSLVGRNPEFVRNFEEQIGENIEEVRRRIADANTNTGPSAEQRLGEALDRTRDLVQGLESMEERMRARQERGSGQERRLGDAQDQQGRGQGERGQQGEGQQGQSQGQGQGQDQGQQGQGQQGQGQQGQGQQGQGQQGQQGQGQGQGQGEGQQGQQGGGQTGQGEGGRAGEPNEAGGGARGTQSGGGGGPAGPGGRLSGGGRLSPDDIRQYSREYRERRQEAEAIRRELQRQGQDVRELDALIARMRQLENESTFGDPGAVQRLQSSVVEGLKTYEYTLRRRLEGPERERLHLGGNDDVPTGFRQLVEEYYKSLSNRPPR